ncbi:tRNA lysidine(34) synthetase TilS [Euzebya sp.]|uniref:tRNA lysidine(34) synthetase TilS n=1 Tax=Euzebya sp. TaxID=1971409 RepID=UPI003514B995
MGDLADLVARLAEGLDDPSVGLGPGATVLVAVSGGPDSVALLHLTAAARPDLRVVVGHVRHGLRDDAADAAAAQANAGALGAPFLERAVQVGPGDGPEDAARRARRAALAAMAREVGAAAVLLAHTADDQAETVLLRIARGTGIAGLAGMAAVAEGDGIRLVRPLLGERRAAVRAAAAGHPWVADPTTDDPEQRRARARHEVLGALSRLHPAEADVTPLLARRAAHARAHLADVPPPGDAGGGAGTRIRRFGMAVTVEAPAGGPAAVEPALRQAWEALPTPPRWPGTAAAARIADLAVGRSVDLPGAVRATRLADAGTGRGPAPPADVPRRRHVLVAVADDPLPAIPLPLDGRVAVPGFGWLDVGRGDDLAGPDPEPPTRPVWRRWDWTAILDAGDGHLAVRGRRPEGDRAARRVLQTVPAALRGQVPLVVDGADRVLMAAEVVLAPPRPGARSVRLTARPDL